MPLYEYKCKKCGHRFERIQSFSAEDVKECPVCQGEVERLISTPARAHFKGSGFYSTDYGAKPASAGKSQDAGQGSSGTSGSEGSSGASDKSGTDRGSADKGSTDKGSADKGTSDKGSASKTESTSSPAAPSSSSKSE
jgi:putative FmdB family regulatory protein